MRRCLFILASVLSLALCIETVVLWVLSQGMGDWVERRKCISVNEHTAIYHRQWFQVADSQLRFVSAEQTLYQDERQTRIREPHVSAVWILYPGIMYFPPLPKTSLMNRLGFAHWTDSYRQTSSNWRLVLWAVPLWVLTLGFAALPMWAIANVLRRRWRIRKGLCPRCGYNLTGNTSGVCPECGTRTAVTAPVPARRRGRTQTGDTSAVGVTIPTHRDGGHDKEMDGQRQQENSSGLGVCSGRGDYRIRLGLDKEAAGLTRSGRH